MTHGVCVLQDHFWMVPVVKRAMTFVFLVRYVLGCKSQMQWKKFTEEDYKLNKRCYKRWGVHEANVFNQSPLYNALSDERAPDDLSSQPKKRKQMDSVTASESPIKRVYTIDSDSTDSE